jgi:GNAT superfamily N-acetyltransferase
VEVVRLEAGDWAAYREIRLAALAESPRAFGSTLADASGLTEPEWRRRLEERVQFLVRLGTERVGTVGAIVEDGAAWLVSLWVEPAWRGRGVGDALVQAVVDWARGAGHAHVRLWVTEDNAAAERLYARHGFVRTGASQPVRPDAPGRLEIEMLRDV